jgi:hypothetical protein
MKFAEDFDEMCLLALLGHKVGSPIGKQVA